MAVCIFFFMTGEWVPVGVGSGQSEVKVNCRAAAYCSTGARSKVGNIKPS